MPDNSTKSKRIAKNTLVLYFRMMFLMLVTLYTSRIILDALGTQNFGIYNVVGGFVSMFGLISTALTSACSRFLNFEMGKGDMERQKTVFSTALSIQWGLAIIVFILSELIGVWYVNNIMVLPSDRLIAANWCFQFSVVTFCLNLITVPYNASIIAHERMKVFAYVSIFQGLATLGISFLVYIDTFDRLIFYAFMIMVIQFIVRLLYQIYCRKHFEECIYKRVFDKPLFRNMLSYSLWHLVGNGASVLKTHGVNLVLNFFYGPAVNAAKGLANQVDAAVNQFVGNFMIAMNPQITQSYAKGELKYMFNLLDKGSRFSFYMVLILSLPIIINAHYILGLWLKNVPDYTVIFTQLTLVAMLLSALSKPLITAQNATGNVRNYQLIVGGINMLNLPFSFVCLYFGASPESVVIVAIIVEIMAFFARVFMLPKTIQEFNAMLFLREVGVKCVLIAIAASILPIIIDYFLPENFWMFCLNVTASLCISSLVIFCLGCSSNEREMILSKVRTLSVKVRKK